MPGVVGHCFRAAQDQRLMQIHTVDKYSVCFIICGTVLKTLMMGKIRRRF